MLPFLPDSRERWVLKRGDTGWAVFATQVAMNAAGGNLVEDGEYGPRTEAGVMALQRRLGIHADGVFGPETGRVWCVRECSASEVGLTPPGLLRGGCEGESGYLVSCTTKPYRNGSRDLGPFQNNTPKDASDARVKETFNIAQEARFVAHIFRAGYEKFAKAPYQLAGEAAWRMAVLNYNWPAGAVQIAAGNRSTWGYWEDDDKGRVGHKGEPGAQPYRLDDPAPWVESYKVTGVSTGWQWALHYIDTKVIYVKSWTVA